MRKIKALILAVLLTLSISGCNGKAEISKEGIMESSLGSTESVHPRDENLNYSFKLSVLNELPTEYNGEKLKMDIALQNKGGAFDYTYIVSVNGVKADYEVISEGSKSDIIRAEKESRTVSTIEFTPTMCKDGEKAVVTIDIMFDPSYRLNSTEYVGFVPHHNITGIMPFIIDIKKGENKTSVCDVAVKKQISDDIKAEYDRERPENPNEKVNLLDSSTFFRFKKDKYDEPYIICEDSLPLHIEALGLSGKYILGIYVNHELQKAFGNDSYCICDIEEGYLTEIDAVIDTSDIDEYSHIYLMAVPYAENENNTIYTYKTETKLLHKNKNTADESSEISSSDAQSSEPSESKLQESSSSSSDTESSSVSYESKAETENPIISPETSYGINSDVDKIIAVKDDIAVLCSSNQKVVFYNIKDKRVISDAGILPGDSVGVTENSIVIYGLNGRYIKIYDFNGKLKKEITPPTLDDSYYSVSYCLSDDEKSFVYSYSDENAVSHVFKFDIGSSVNKEICTIKPKESNNTIQSVNNLLSYKNNVISCKGSWLVNSDTHKITEYIGRIDDKGNISCILVLDEYEHLMTNEKTEPYHFVVVEGYKPDSSASTSKLVKICRYGDDVVSEFATENNHDNHHAFVSKNMKYIATENDNSDSNDVILKVYDYRTKRKLIEETISGIGFDVKFSEDESVLYVLSQNIIKIYKLS